MRRSPASSASQQCYWRAQGKKVGEVRRSLGVTEETYLLRWRNEYGGLKLHQRQRLQTAALVAAEGAGARAARLRKAVSDLALDKMILKEAASGNEWRYSTYPFWHTDAAGGGIHPINRSVCYRSALNAGGGSGRVLPLVTLAVPRSHAARHPGHQS